MVKTKVSIVKLDEYQGENTYTALNRSLNLLGGLEKIIKPGSRVFVKINHLSPPSPPEKAIITHPLFTKQVVKLLKEFGLKIIVGDDIQSEGRKDGFLVSGYRQVCNELGIRLVNLKEAGFREVECKGDVLKRVYISRLVLESDFIINLPKLKTHSFTVFTGAVKNMFGIIPRGLRLDYHRQYMKNEVFSQMLVDIFACFPPHLSLMDGIIAMEGEGPSSGNLVNAGLILASQDAVAVDTVVSKIIGYNPLDIYTTLFAHERGLGVGKMENIEIVGESIQDIELKNFKKSALAVGLLRRKIPSFLHAYIQSQLIFIPEVVSSRCTACMECINVCPPNAAKLIQDSSWIDKKLCIHCMCCHEVCRFKAIKLKQSFMGKVTRGIVSLYEMIMSLIS